MEPIQTFVFMDFGCVYGDPDNLTEVSLLAVPRSQYLQPENIEKPQAMMTLDLSSNRFNLNTYNEINNFINLQQKPVCVVSHNGNRFDFIILKRELQKLNVGLSYDVLCADCQYAFYDILKEEKPCRNVPEEKDMKSSTKNNDNYCSNSNNVTNKMLSDINVTSHQTYDKTTNIKTYEQNKKEDTIPDIYEKQGPNGDIIEEERTNPSTSNVNHFVDLASEQIADSKQDTNTQGYTLNEDLDDNNMQPQNENTPVKRQLDATKEHMENKRQKLDSNLLNPGNAKRRLDFDYIYKGKAVRRIYYEGDDKPKVSYTLGAIYDREVTDPPIKPHPTANDVYMKFRISHKLGKRFLAWTDQIQLKFADVVARKIIMSNRDRF